MTMNFDPELCDRWSVDDTEFEYNFERVTHIANDSNEQFLGQINKMAKHLKSKKKGKKAKARAAGNIEALYNEWHVTDADETLYLVFSKNQNGETFTDVTTDNILYATENKLDESA